MISIVVRGYRLVLLLKPDIKKEARDKLFDEIKKWLGEVKNDKVELLGEKKLTYPVKRERRGEYAVLAFESEKVDIDLNKRLLIKDEVLRHLLVRS